MSHYLSDQKTKKLIFTASWLDVLH